MSTLIFPEAGSYKSAALLTTMNLYEHETLIILPENLHSEIGGPHTISGATHIAVQERMGEIVKWVERGHTLIVLGLHPINYNWAERGNVRRATIEQLPPFNQVQLTARSGASIRSDLAVASLLDPFIGSISYEYVLQAPNLIPLLLVKTTQKTVGRPDIAAGALQLGDGFVVFAPDDRTTAYWEALERLPSMLRTSKAELPPWVDRFRTVWERDAFDNMSAAMLKMEKLEADISTLGGEIEQARQVKQLFVGTGTSFEAAVASALSEIGLQVVMGPHPRADLLATNGQRVAAIEAKGIEGAAKEEYVRQVTMWMPEVDAALAAGAEPTDDPVLEDYRRQLVALNLSDINKDQDCKGILVLGTFRLIPLDQRTQPDFSENVKAVLIRRDVCALTGIQLFVLLMLSRSDPALKQQIQQALFSTRGVLEFGRDWTEALDLAEQD